MLEYSPKIDHNHIAQVAEIDKYPRPIKKQQPNYHTKNNCTWYVHNKRNQTKRYLPSSFTDAKSWLNEAKRAGFATGKKPIAGSILQTSKGGGGYGTRTLTKKQAAQYNYIY